MNPAKSFRALAAAATCAFAVPAQLQPSTPWASMGSGAISARTGAAMAYDAARDATYLFGGYSGGGGMSDTWRWNGASWSAVVGAAAPGRFGHAMTYDRVRRCLVMFGGFQPSGGVPAGATLGDTWEFDGSVWQQRATAVAPPPRGGHAMVFDTARNRTLLFGGASGTAFYDDLWEWDGTAWTALATSSRPSPRRGAACAYDSARARTVLFGGRNAAGVLGDTWELAVGAQGAQWTQAFPSTSPSARAEAAIVFDPLCAIAVVGGGSSGAAGTSALGDWWAWNGAAWAQAPLDPAGNVSPRSGAATAFDFRRGVALLFGGQGGGGALFGATFRRDGDCPRSMLVEQAANLGTTARFRYAYPARAANNLVLWLVTTPMPSSFLLPFGDFYVHNEVRVDLVAQLASQAGILSAAGADLMQVAVPAQANLVGFAFDVQALDLELTHGFLHWARNDLAVVVGAADFTASATFGPAPLAVQFTDTSTNQPTSWQWDFDDNGVVDSTLQNPTFTYTQNGVYSVRLVASNAVGSSTVTKRNLVGVGFPTPGPTGLADMVPIAPGTFQMGSLAWVSTFSYEAPVHAVTLTQPFWMARYEVTQAQYQALMGVNPSFFQGVFAPNAAQRPVEQVNWHDARAYCAALTASEQAAGRVPAGYEYRLPTEAEWEYCCRAGTTTEYHTGVGLLFTQANFYNLLANSTYPSGQTSVVGSYPANPWGLHDVHGNVWEWVLDAWSLYPANPVFDPFTSGTNNQSRTFRGGCWHTTWTTTRSAIRSHSAPGTTGPSQGFRVVLAPVRTP